MELIEYDEYLKKSCTKETVEISEQFKREVEECFDSVSLTMQEVEEYAHFIIISFGLL